MYFEGDDAPRFPPNPSLGHNRYSNFQPPCVHEGGCGVSPRADVVEHRGGSFIGDDGTTLEIPAWCSARSRLDPRLKYHRNPRRMGLAGNWNEILARASGQFVILLGDDDLLLPEFVAKLMAAASSETSVVFCNHYVMDGNGRRLERETRECTLHFHRADLPAGQVRVPAVSAWQLAICPSAVLVRTADAMRLGFRNDLNSPDVEFFIRLAHDGARFDFLPDFLSEFRVHSNSATASGLRNDRLAEALLSIPAPPEIEPYKRELLSALVVNAVSCSLSRGDVAGARRLLCCGYYPPSAAWSVRALQWICALLPAPSEERSIVRRFA